MRDPALWRWGSVFWGNGRAGRSGHTRLLECAGSCRDMVPIGREHALNSGERAGVAGAGGSGEGQHCSRDGDVLSSDGDHYSSRRRVLAGEGDVPAGGGDVLASDGKVLSRSGGVSAREGEGTGHEERANRQITRSPNHHLSNNQIINHQMPSPSVLSVPSVVKSASHRRGSRRAMT